jgi:hypothetical protein
VTARHHSALDSADLAVTRQLAVVGVLYASLAVLAHTVKIPGPQHACSALPVRTAWPAAHLPGAVACALLGAFLILVKAKLPTVPSVMQERISCKLVSRLVLWPLL